MLDSNTMSTSDVKVIGVGSRSVIVTGMKTPRQLPLWENKINHPSNEYVYKVSTDISLHQKELANAIKLSQLDPQQRFLLYPIASYDVPGNKRLLEKLDKENNVPGKIFSVEAPHMYVNVVAHGGTSVMQLSKQQKKLMPAQAKQAIRALMDGLKMLHQNHYVHGDAHAHNAVIQFGSDGQVTARWIDFGEMRPSHNDFQTDVKKFITVIIMITKMVDSAHDDAHIRALVQVVSKGAPPMSAKGLSDSIGKYLSLSEVSSSREKKQRSRGSTSPNDRSLRRALF